MFRRRRPSRARRARDRLHALKLFEFFAAALDALWANRLRSALTMIGIVIGTAAVIAIFAIGQSAASSIGGLLGQIGNLGILVFPQSQTAYANQSQITWHDVQTIRDACSRCAHVYPRYTAYEYIRIGHRRDAFILASRSDYNGDNLPLAEGRKFDSDDVAGARPVAMLVWSLKQKLFGDGPAVGREIRVAGKPFTVVGVFANISSGVLQVGPGNAVFIPYTTFHALPDSVITSIQVYPSEGTTPARAIDEITSILQRIHGPRTKYRGIDVSQQFNAFLSVIDYVAVGISAVGAIALVVGGIGVMNIMLVSVIERTREIGIRKAIGASQRDILVQFLFEAVAITLIGGVVGIVLGSGMALVASHFLITQLSGHPGTIAWAPLIVGALAFSALVGIFFGTYPAVRASRLEPIEALRHE
mgnify:CR=1 FL=1